MQTDRPFIGILLMLGFCVLAPLGDSIGKLLGATIGIALLVFVRFSIQVVLLLPIMLLRKDNFRLPPGTLGLISLRTCLHICGIAMMFLGLRYLPLADALAIAFVMPFIMLLLGHFILHEEVGRHRLAACAVGFVGTLLVIQPNFAAVGTPALYPLGVAVVFSLFMLITRQVAKKLDPIKLQAVSGMQATLFLLPLFFLLPNQPEFAVTLPSATTMWLLAALGVLGTLAHLMMTWSLRFAPSATLAPMQYLEIPFGTLLGWLIFKDLPNGLAAVGIMITIAAGLYIILREQRLSQSPVATKAE